MALIILMNQTVEAKKWVVEVKNNSFSPFNLTHVKAGDTIQFVWTEGVHSTTSTEIPEGALDWDYPITQQEPVGVIKPMVNGTYWYVSTPDTAVQMKGTFTVSGALGTGSLTGGESLRVFPVPAYDHADIFSGPEQIVSLRIFSMSGRLAGVFDFHDHMPFSKHTIDLKNWPSGIYLFEFILSQDKKKIIRVLHQAE